MRYLLDTHIAIWVLGDKTRLSPNARFIIDDLSNPLYISLISVWEIAIKVSTGKLQFSGGSKAFIKQLHSIGIKVLAINSNHLHYIETLPFIHRDPFDRLLIASALAEDMVIVTADKNIQKYSVSWTW